MEFKPTSGLESTTSQKNRNFTRQQAKIRDKQKIPAQDAPTLNNERAIIKSKSVSGLSTLFSGKSIGYSLQKAEIGDEQKIPTQDSLTLNNEKSRAIPKSPSMLPTSLSDKSIDYSLQKVKIGDEQKMSSQDSSTSNNQVARDSKPRSRLEHSKSKESPKNIIDTLREKGATEQEIAQFKEHTTSLYQKTLDMWKKHQPEEFSRDDRLKFFQTTIQVFESWHQVHKEQATEQEISQFKEHTNSLYQQTLTFSQEMLKECQAKKITREYYPKADKIAIRAFDLWLKS
jgi:hypothetical protein